MGRNNNFTKGHRQIEAQSSSRCRLMVLYCHFRGGNLIQDVCALHIILPTDLSQTELAGTTT